MNNLLGLSLGQISAGLVARQFSPTDIADACTACYELLEDKCLAWEVFDPAVLKRQALATEKRLAAGEKPRALEAIPFGVKDIFNTIDFPTQMGSPLWKDFTPGNDARIVFNAREVGAIIPGKTTTAEFAVHALAKTLNPFSHKHTPGTSSSGSAVAVATRMVPVSLGSQTAGSITRPASFCGVYGMKPSFGLLPRTGMLKTTDSLDTVGFFTAHQADLRSVLNALRVRGSNYPIVHERVDRCSPRPANKPWRVAFMRTHTWDGAEDYVKLSILDWMCTLAKEKDVVLVEIEEPLSLSDAHQIHSIIYDKALSYYFKGEFKRHELISPVMYEIISRGNEISQEQYLAALKSQSDMAAVMDVLLSDFDALVSLGTASAAPLRNSAELPDPSLMWTLTYLPTISVPLFRAPSGLPFSLQFCARRYTDLRLLDLIDTLVTRGLIPEQSFRADGNILVNSLT